MLKAYKSVYFALFVLVCSSFASEAESILAKSGERLKSAKIWSMDFRVESRVSDGSVQAAYKGDFLLGSGDRFRLRLPGQHYYSDGISLWQYNELQKQVMIKNSVETDGGMHPSEVMFRYLKCKPLSLSKGVFQGVPVHIIQLDPKGQVKAFTAMEVWLKESDQTPVKIVTTDKTGSTTLYEITNLRKDPNLGDSAFRFVATKDVEEIDMR
jgi:outer membrane lipoprotein carrier protein